MRAALIQKLFCCLILFRNPALAQYEFTAPLNASMYHDINRNIILRPGPALDASTIKKNSFTILGTKSGAHDFKLTVCSDQKTIILQPFSPFEFGEKVTVEVKEAIRDRNGNDIPPYSFYFYTREKLTVGQEKAIAQARLQAQDLMEEVSSQTPSSDIQPNNFYTVLTNNNAAPGQIFFSTFSGLGHWGKRLWIIDNNGDSVFSQQTPNRTYDFKINHIGYPTVYDQNDQSFDVLDSNFVRQAHYHCQNGYFTDDHEFQIFPDHRLFLIGDQFIGMTVYPTGDSASAHSALVTENVIQELDGDGDVVFEWRSIDHMSVNEAWHENLYAWFIDAVHMNAIERDTDGNILISCRKLDQIDKIDLKTGNFIWRLGGLKNEFTFINDPAKFNYQHDIRRLPNGDITLFDNGAYHIPSRAFAKEYKVDEVNKTATLVWSYAHPDINGKPVTSSAEGNVQRLANGNTLINWGWIPYNSGFPNVTEVDAAGNITWEMQCEPSEWPIIYRAFKFDWNPCARPSERKMKAAVMNDSSVLFSWNRCSGAVKYFLQYRKEGDGFWNSLNVNADQFSVTADLDPNSSYEWRMQTWCDLTGNSHSGFTNKLPFSTGGERVTTDQNYFSIYPNPVKDEVFISWKQSFPYPSFIIEITDLPGHIVITKSVSGNQDVARIPVSELQNGIYFIKVVEGKTVFTRRFVKIE